MRDLAISFFAGGAVGFSAHFLLSPAERVARKTKMVTQAHNLADAVLDWFESGPIGSPPPVQLTAGLDRPARIEGYASKASDHELATLLRDFARARATFLDPANQQRDLGPAEMEPGDWNAACIELREAARRLRSRAGALSQKGLNSSLET